MAGPSTKLIHAGDELSRVSDVIPPINVTTTFEYNKNPEKLVKAKDSIMNSKEFIYARAEHPNSVQVERAIGELVDAHVVSYNSGLSAFNAIVTYLNPKVICVGEGYHGVHGIIDLAVKNHGVKKISLEDELNQLNEGDLIHLETPVNPTGYNHDIKYYADRAHKRGAFLVVDATLAPPPIQDPFDFGADIVLHSATKYFGGHSDLLAGLIFTKDLKVKKELLVQRLILGTNIANLESSLLIRSLKTYELRVKKQVENGSKLVEFLVKNKNNYPKLKEIYHGSLQKDAFISRQLPSGQSPVFSIKLATENDARYFPSKLKYFIHATSLGGCESLIEWRALSDETIDQRILRVSVGVENIDDLIKDLDSALRSS